MAVATATMGPQAWDPAPTVQEWASTSALAVSGPVPHVQPVCLQSFDTKLQRPPVRCCAHAIAPLSMSCLCLEEYGHQLWQITGDVFRICLRTMCVYTLSCVQRRRVLRVQIPKPQSVDRWASVSPPAVCGLEWHHVPPAPVLRGHAQHVLAHAQHVRPPLPVALCRAHSHPNCFSACLF